MATTTIQSRLYPYTAPIFDVMVILLGPKTTAAVIIPGPNDNIHFLNEINMPFFTWVIVVKLISLVAILIQVSFLQTLLQSFKDQSSKLVKLVKRSFSFLPRPYCCTAMIVVNPIHICSPGSARFRWYIV